MARTLTIHNSDIFEGSDDQFQMTSAIWSLLRGVACSYRSYKPGPGPIIPEAEATTLAVALEELLPDLRMPVATVQCLDEQCQDGGFAQEVLCGPGWERRIERFIAFLREGDFEVVDDRPMLKVVG